MPYFVKQICSNLFPKTKATTACHRSIRSCIFYTLSFLVDAYTIARMLKVPEARDGKATAASRLSLCYFGNHHIEYLRTMLTSIGYDHTIILERNEDAAALRCVDLSKHVINLREMLRAKHPLAHLTELVTDEAFGSQARLYLSHIQAPVNAIF